MGASIEVVRNVYDDDEGVFLQISPDPDTGSWVQISTVDKSSIEHWGDVRLTINPVFARKLAEGILATVDELEKDKKP